MTNGEEQDGSEGDDGAACSAVYRTDQANARRQVRYREGDSGQNEEASSTARGSTVVQWRSHPCIIPAHERSRPKAALNRRRQLLVDQRQQFLNLPDVVG